MELQLNQKPLPNLKEIQDPFIPINQSDEPVEKDIRRSFIPPNPLSNPFVSDTKATYNQPIKKPSRHIRSLIGNTILLCIMVTLPVMYATGSLEMSEGAVIGICLGVYAVYLVFVLFQNPLFSYLNSVLYGTTLSKYYSKIKSKTGYFVFRAECYHYQTTYDTYVDDNGNAQTVSTTVKVVTHVAHQTLTPLQTKDNSTKVGHLQTQSALIFVHNIVDYMFGDEKSRNYYHRKYMSFKGKNKSDQYQQYSENFKIDIDPRVSIAQDNNSVDYLSPLLILFTLIGLIWPFSMSVERKVCRTQIYYLKVLFF